MDKCNCGREWKYIHLDSEELSCNKYSVCPTYGELENKVKELKTDLSSALTIADELSTFREGSTSYFKAVDKLHTLQNKYQGE